MDAQAMIAFQLTSHDLALAVGWLAAGMVIGAVHFLSLRWNVRMLTADRPLLPIVAIQLGRFATLAVVLALITQTSGALPLLAAALGILAARTVIVRKEA
jgi:F1F0 ATPase subunit 2